MRHSPSHIIPNNKKLAIISKFTIVDIFRLTDFLVVDIFEITDFLN